LNRAAILRQKLWDRDRANIVAFVRSWQSAPRPDWRRCRPRRPNSTRGPSIRLRTRLWGFPLTPKHKANAHHTYQGAARALPLWEYPLPRWHRLPAAADSACRNRRNGARYSVRSAAVRGNRANGRAGGRGSQEGPQLYGEGNAKPL